MPRLQATRTTVQRVALALALVVAVTTAGTAVHEWSGGPPQLPGHWSLALLEVVVLLCAAVLVRAGAVGDERLDLALVVVLGLPGVATAAQLVLSGEAQNTTVLGLVLVTAGAVGPRRSLVLVVLAVVDVAWLAAAAGQGPPDDAVLGGAVRLGLATVVAVAVHEVRHRSEQRLRDALAAMAEHVGELDVARSVVAESERRFHGVFSHSPIAVSLSDERGLFVEVNAALCALVDRPAAQLIGRSAGDITHPDDDRRINANAGRLIAESPDGVARCDVRYVRPDGTMRDGLLSLKSVPGPHGENWTLAHVVDVTEILATERALRRSEADLQAVSAITRAVQEGRDPRPVVLAAMLELSGASHTSVIERLDAENLVVSGQSGVPELEGTVIPLASTSATVHTWRTGTTLYLREAARSPLANPALLELRSAASLLLEPVRDQGEVVAVLCTAWTEVLDEVPEDARRSARMLADELGPALTAGRLRAELEAMATTDPLTRVANRRGWDERMTLLLADSRRTGRPLTLALVDLDHFKSFNDTHGHTAGDELLRSFAAGAAGALREVDAFARWGGEEFVIALPDCQVGAVTTVLERVRACVPAGQTCSIGYAVWDGAETPAQCLSRADVALYRAKLDGRDRVLAASGSEVTPPAGA